MDSHTQQEKDAIAPNFNISQYVTIMYFSVDKIHAHDKIETPIKAIDCPTLYSDEPETLANPDWHEEIYLK